MEALWTVASFITTAAEFNRLLHSWQSSTSERRGRTREGVIRRLMGGPLLGVMERLLSCAAPCCCDVFQVVSINHFAVEALSRVLLLFVLRGFPP